MTILFMDGFDSYGSSYTADARWTVTASLAYGVAGRFGGLCLAGNVASTNINHSLGTSKSSLSVGFAIKTPGKTTSFFTFNNAGAGICAFYVNTSGDLVFTRGTSISSNILATVVGAVSLNSWHYIGIEFTRHATAGAVNIYVDGVRVVNLTGVNTGASDITDVQFNLASSSYMVDDYYCVDGATWLGERRIVTLRPSADTAQKDFTPNSGANNYSRVSEIPTDGDTSYISAATVGNEDLYDLNDLSFTPTSIDAVQMTFVARKDDAATRTLAAVLKSGATTDVGPDHAMAASYTVSLDLHTVDPDTSAAWTTSAVNALQAGVKVTT